MKKVCYSLKTLSRDLIVHKLKQSGCSYLVRVLFDMFTYRKFILLILILFVAYCCCVCAFVAWSLVKSKLAYYVQKQWQVV